MVRQVKHSETDCREVIPENDGIFDFHFQPR
jgi:hypothetical protein